MGAMTRRELDSPPRLLPLYAKAALSGILPGDGGDDLPDLELVLRDVDIDAGRLAAYAQVCGYRLVDHLPPTYPHVLAFPLAVELMADRRFPFALPGLVHVANTIVAHRPIAVSERLTFRVRAERLRPHPAGRAFDLAATAEAGGEVVWEGASTYLRRGGGNGGGDTDDPHLPVPSFTAKWRIDGDVGRRYAAVSGDRNPIHLHPLTARLFGFPRPIAHGMWTKARALAALEGRLPAAFEVEVAFRKPLLLPASVRFRSEEDAGRWRFAVEPRDGGTPHLTGALTRPRT